MMLVTLSIIDKLEKVSFFIFEKAACSIFLPGQATRAAGFSGALRKVPHMVKDSFFLVYSENWLYSGETLRFL